MTQAPHSRAGIVSIWVLIVLSVLTALGAAATWQYLTLRRVLRERAQARQSTWLARSGIEIAAARLLADSNYRGETLELIPDSRLEVVVERRASPADTFEIHATARLPATRQPHVRASTRTFHRSEAAGKVRLAVVEPDTP